MIVNIQQLEETFNKTPFGGRGSGRTFAMCFLVAHMGNKTKGNVIVPVFCYHAQIPNIRALLREIIRHSNKKVDCIVDYGNRMDIFECQPWWQKLRNWIAIKILYKSKYWYDLVQYLPRPIYGIRFLSAQYQEKIQPGAIFTYPVVDHYFWEGVESKTLDSIENDFGPFVWNIKDYDERYFKDLELQASAGNNAATGSRKKQFRRNSSK